MSDAPSLEKISCANSDCTIAQSGTCLKGFANYQEECPDFTVETINSSSDSGDHLIAPTELPSTEKVTDNENRVVSRGRTFWPGTELALKDASEIMRAEYTHLIGLIGLSEVGKTCYLISLFILIDWPSKLHYISIEIVN